MRYTLIIFGAAKPIHPADQASAWAAIQERHPEATAQAQPMRREALARTATQDVMFLQNGAVVGRALVETMSMREFVLAIKSGTLWEA